MNDRITPRDWDEGELDRMMPRDYFAASVIGAILTDGGLSVKEIVDNASEFANTAYAVADAMMERRRSLPLGGDDEANPGSIFK